MKSLTDSYKLSNGVEIPCIGFGTWQTPEGNVTVDSVKSALKAGYRHIDTAAAYGNEEGVGKAVKESGLDRKDVFVTSKLWNTDRGYDKTLKAFDTSLKKLGMDYLDLYLIHWPSNKEDGEQVNYETWKAFEELYDAGKIRAIGVSNFLQHHLEALMTKAKVTPMVNQIEFHPGFMQEETVKFCQSKDILIEAWSPLGTGKMLKNEQLMEIAAKYNRSVAQLCIRWCLQNKTLPLPKSVTPERIVENGKVFDFEISDEDMKKINSLPYIGGSGLNPDTVKF